MIILPASSLNSPISNRETRTLSLNEGANSSPGTLVMDDEACRHRVESPGPPKRGAGG